MDNTELSLIPVNSSHEYYADTQGNIWRKLKGRPRHKGEGLNCYRQYGGDWFKYIQSHFGGKKESKNYLRVEIEGKSYPVHRLILLTFCPHPHSEFLQVNHKDRNTFNNQLGNLEWVTCRENIHHYWKTKLPDTYENLRSAFIVQRNALLQNSDEYQSQPMGSWQIKHDIDAIAHELANSPDDMQTIAKRLGVSFRAVRYWQEKMKIERPKLPTLLEKTNLLLSESPNLTPKEIAQKLNVRVTSIHAVLRKRKSVTTIEPT